MQAGGGHGREGEDEASNNIAGSASRCERLGRPEEELGWLDPRQHCLESVWWGTGPTSEIVLWLLCRGERRDLDLISIQRSCPDFRSTLGDCSPRAAFPPGTRETRTRVQPYPPGIPNKGTVYCHYYPGAPSRASSGYPRRSSPLHVRVGGQAELYLCTRQLGQLGRGDLRGMMDEYGVRLQRPGVEKRTASEAGVLGFSPALSAMAAPRAVLGAVLGSPALSSSLAHARALPCPLSSWLGAPVTSGSWCCASVRFAR